MLTKKKNESGCACFPSSFSFDFLTHMTDARRACSRGVIGSTMGAYPRGTGSNLVEGNGHFFPACRQPYLSSFSDAHTHMHARTLTHTHARTLALTHF